MPGRLPHVSKVLCTIYVNDGCEQPLHQLQANQCADGMLRLFLDGEPMPQSIWPLEDVDTCIDEFLAKSHELRQHARSGHA